MRLEFTYFFVLTGTDGRERKGRVKVRAAREREADVLAAEQLRAAGLLRPRDSLLLRCLSRA